MKIYVTLYSFNNRSILIRLGPYIVKCESFFYVYLRIQTKQSSKQADENKDMFILVQEIKERINERLSVFIRRERQVWQAFIVAIFAPGHPRKSTIKWRDAPNDAENYV